MRQIIVTTGDIKQPYDILGPVYFQVSNKGLLSNSLDRLKAYYSAEIQQKKAHGEMSEYRADWGFLYGEWSVGQSDFEAAFFIATEEIKKRAMRVGADAVICMRQDIDMDTNGFCYFYLQMYGTAVKLRKEETSLAEQYDHAEELLSRGNFADAEIVYHNLGDFRDSKEKAKESYAALLTAKYDCAEEKMIQKDYYQAEQIYTSLRDYKDSKAKAEAAHIANEAWKASLAAPVQKANEHRTWICPSCGKENVYFVYKCSCGTSR